MIRIQPLTRDKQCSGCTLDQQEDSALRIGRPLRYFRVYIYADEQYRPSQSLCEDCLHTLRHAIDLVLKGG